MKKVIKYGILSVLIFFIIFIIIWTTLNFTFENLNGAYKAMISGGVTAFLAPRVQILKTQFGTQRQLRWIFLRKPISF